MYVYPSCGIYIFHICVCVCIHTHTHIFFIHSSVDGHIGCFHVLAIVNSAAMNIVVHVSFWIIVSSGYICPEVRLLDHMARSLHS